MASTPVLYVESRKLTRVPLPVRPGLWQQEPPNFKKLIATPYAHHYFPF